MLLKQWLLGLIKKYKTIKGLLFSPILTCFFSGVLYVLPYYHDKLFVLSFVALVLLFLTLLKNNKKHFFGYFFSFSFGFYFPLYFWMSRLYPFNGFGFTPSQAKIIIVLACLGIPLVHSFLHTIVMSLTKLLPKNDYIITIGYGVAWIISEWFMSLGALGFPWGRAALSQAGSLVQIQTVSLFGSYFIVVVLVCSSMMLALSLKYKNRLYALIGALIIVFNAFSGLVLYLTPVKTEDSIKVAVLQGNASMEDKWSGEKSTREIWDTYILMAYEAAKNDAELIVLPESAIPIEFSNIYNSYAKVASECNITILSGVLEEDNKTGGKYNSVIAVYPDGSVSKRYDKRHLVPFGEFIPYRNTLESLIPFVEGLKLGGFDTIEGVSSQVIKINGVKNGSLVCFDSIFDELARESVNDGAEILTVVTNDSWFKDSVGIEQHLKHSVLRATENRRPVIRAANTGISAFISPKGEIIELSEPLTEAIIYSEIYPVKDKTLYTIMGNLVLYVSILFQIAVIIRYIIVKIYKNNNKEEKNYADN